MNNMNEQNNIADLIDDAKRYSVMCCGEYTYFTKYNLLKVYELMHDHLFSDRVQEEDAFFTLMMKINMTLITIPEDTHDKIVTFALQEIGPLALDAEIMNPAEFSNVLPFSSTDEGDDILDNLKKQFDPIFQTVEKLERFAVEVINPILWS